MAPKNALGPSPFTPLVSGVVSGMVQVSEHEVRKPVWFRSLHAEKEGEELFCWNKGGDSYVRSMGILFGRLEFITVKQFKVKRTPQDPFMILLFKNWNRL